MWCLDFTIAAALNSFIFHFAFRSGSNISHPSASPMSTSVQQQKNVRLIWASLATLLSINGNP